MVTYAKNSKKITKTLSLGLKDCRKKLEKYPEVSSYFLYFFIFFIFF